MSQAYDFLRECGVFFVLTVHDGTPMGRPFGAVMEHGGKLYIATSPAKAVYRQIQVNPRIQILALKNGTRTWVRISGRAEECIDLSIKQKMLDECPVLTKHYPTADCKHFALFGVEISDVNMAT